MAIINTRPLTTAALITAVTIAGSGIHSVDITPPRLHAEIASVKLLAVAEPAVILTDIVKAAVSLAGAAVWYVGFPVTLPVSLIMGAVLSVYISGISMGQTAPDPLLSGLRFFLAMPALLVQTSLAELGLSLGLVEPAAPPAAATHKQLARSVSVTAARPAGSARSPKRSAAAKVHGEFKKPATGASRKRQATSR